MLDQVRKTVEQYHMLEHGDSVIVGVSGGADSVALLMALLALREEYALTITAVHVNHMLREAAKEEQAYVEELCRQNQIVCRVFCKEIASYAKECGCSTEEAGRRYRYQCFAQVAEEIQGSKVAVAHHKNDRVETVLFHMARGTGLKGMQGIPPTRDLTGDGAHLLIRPLYQVDRETIETYLDQNRIRYYNDESNRDDRYSRNRIRNRVIPELTLINQQAVRHIEGISDVSMAYWDYVEQEAIRYEQEYVNDHCLSVEELCRCPELMIRHVIYRQIVQAGGQERDIAEIHIEQVMNLLKMDGEKRCNLPYGVQVVKCYDLLRFERQDSCSENEYKNMQRDGLKDCILYSADAVMIMDSLEETDRSPEHEMELNGQMIGLHGVGACLYKIFSQKEQFEISKKTYTKVFDYDTIKGALYFRNPRMGDYMIIDAQGSRKKVSRILIDQKLPRELREQILVVADGSHVIWIPGIRISEACKITKDTCRILELRLEREAL